MKLALVATLITFAGSLAGFGLASSAGGPPAVARSAPTSSPVEVVAVSREDCPGRDAEDRA